MNQMRIELSREKCARQLAAQFAQNQLPETPLSNPMAVPINQRHELSPNSTKSLSNNIVPTGKQLPASPQPSPTAAQTIKPPNMESSYETVKHIKWDADEEYECFCFLKKVGEHFLRKYFLKYNIIFSSQVFIVQCFLVLTCSS